MVDRSKVITPAGDTAWVYDPQHNEIDFVSKANGTLYSYSLTQDAFTRTLAIGGTPSSIAISPDGQTLVIGNASAAPNVAITRVTLATNAIDQVVAPAGAGSGVAHITVDGKGAVIFDTLGSGRYFTFPVAAAAPTVQNGPAVGGGSTDFFIISPDHRYLELQDSVGAPSIPVLYDATSGGVVAYGPIVQGFHFGQGDVSNSGLVVDITGNAIEVFDQQMHLVRDLSAYQHQGAAAAAAFSQDGRDMFLWDTAYKTVSVFDTQTWAKINATGTTFAADSHALPTASMQVVDHGTMLALNDGTHVELIDLQARLGLSPGAAPAGSDPTLPFPVGGPTLTNVTVTGDMDGVHLSDLLGATITGADDVNFSASGPGALAIKLTGSSLTYSNNQLVSGTVVQVDFTDVQHGVTTLHFGATTTWPGWAASSFETWLVNDNAQGAFQTILAGDDQITGSVGADVLRGYDGADRINGMGGADTAFGGAGNDIIYATAPGSQGGSPASTYLRGEDGDDYIAGGPGFDDINGNQGNDTLGGGAGDDWVVGGKDNDLLFGEAGNDIVYGNLGSDTCVGGDGNDLIRGGQANDVLYGGAGNDWLSGDRGDDTLTGGSGADIFHSFSGAGVDRVLDFSIAEGDRVQLDPGTAYTVSQVGADTVIDMGAGDRMTLVGVQVSALPQGWIFGA